MKALIITDNLIKGGKERRLLEFLRFIDKDDTIKTTLVLLKDRIEYPVVHTLKNAKLVIVKRRIKKDPTVYFTLWSICDKYKPDLVHSWGTMPSVYISTICYFKRIPFINGIIVNAKCSILSEDWIRSKLTFPFSDIILGNSKAGIAAYKANKNKAIVIYNGYNFDRNISLATVASVKEKYEINTNYIIGMIAAFHPRKDYETFLKAADNITKQRTDVTFIAIGDGPLLKLYKNKYQQNTQIKFLGKINDVESLIQLFTVGVLLTNPKKHQEGISNAILEMMAQKIPVIGTDGGGTSEIIVDGKTGYLIPEFSNVELEKYIVQLIENKELNEEFGNNAFQRVNEVFSIHQMCSKMVELYHSIET
ncbi:MAG: glycosyltransferase [Bacteroidales bacterium]|nr:glycosyltransferase [Bacteroidales bacterium]MBN2820705.1 glycosyltransferase [Bacteroidales bacterium]